MKEECFLCGEIAEVDNCDRGNAKEFRCENQKCGIYQITIGAMKHRDIEERKQDYSKMATSLQQVQLEEKILRIFLNNGNLATEWKEDS